MSIKNRHRSALLIAVFLCVSLIGFLAPSVAFGEVDIVEDEFYNVTRVIDGDTIEIGRLWQSAVVRLLGVDTPETVDPRKSVQCFGHEAKNESVNLMLEKRVRFVFSPSRELRDKYGRYLAYVYLEDGTNVNEYLLRKGFAREYTFGKPYSMRDKFISVQREAQKAKNGLWGKCD